MATNLTDGTELVWIVFDNDGYECSNFVGVFDSQAEAEQVADRIRELTRAFYHEHTQRAWAGSVEVRGLVVGQYELPPDAAYMMEGTDERD